MDSKEFLTSYLNDFSDLVKPDKKTINQLLEVAVLLKEIHINNDSKNKGLFI